MANKEIREFNELLNPSADDILLIQEDSSNITKKVKVSNLTKDIASGTYTPTLTPSFNLDSATAKTTMYTRIGNIVTVTGIMEINPTASSSVCLLDISLPIDPDNNFANLEEAAGVAGGLSYASGEINAKTTSKLVRLSIYSPVTTNNQISFSFSYRLDI
jgi:hypothetical protein